jgi:hypothetical protein
MVAAISSWEWRRPSMGKTDCPVAYRTQEAQLWLLTSLKTHLTSCAPMQKRSYSNKYHQIHGPLDATRCGDIKLL